MWPLMSTVKMSPTSSSLHFFLLLCLPPHSNAHGYAYLISYWKQNKGNTFLNHKISHICRVHWRHLMSIFQWFLITGGTPHLRTKLFTSIPHKCALTFIVVNYLHLKCWIMKLRLLMVQKWNPQHFKLPASLSLLASLPRSLSNSCVLKSHFRKLRWLFSHTFCVSEYYLWQERCQYVYVEKKKIVDTKRKRKHSDNLYSLCYCAFLVSC